MKNRTLFLFPFLFIMASCQKYYLSIYQEKIDQSSLASSYVGSPDPRQKNPPTGQELIMEWQVPQEIIDKKASICLDVIYRDYSEAEFVYPISHKTGYVTYFLLDAEYKQKKGLLSYKGEIRTDDGEVFRSWQHQLWVKVIRLEDAGEEEPEEEIIPEADEQDEEEESATFFPPTY